VSKYKDPGLAACSTADEDAEGLAAALEEHGGFDEVALFTDDVPEKDPSFPSHQHIQKYLRELASKTRTPDTVLFSFSGHGFTDGSGRPFLLVPGSRTDQLPETAVPLEELFESFKKMGVRKTIVVIDAARGGSSGPSQGVYPDRYLRKGVSAVFYSAAKGYSSQADDTLRHSLFAHNLIQGVRGEADRRYGGNRDGVVTLKELASYVDIAFAEWRIQTRGRQVPFVEIIDRANTDMTISSAEKVGTARPRVRAKPQVAASAPEKETKERAGSRMQPVPRGGPGVVRPGVPGAPAPRIEELVKEAKPAASGDEERSLPVGGAKPDERKDEVKVVFKERAPEHEKVLPPAPKVGTPDDEEKPAPAVKEGVGSAPESPLSPAPKGREEPVQVVPQGRAARTAEEDKLAFPAERRGLLRLRSRPKEVSAEEVKSILINNGFYSTCWNYNGDFCNPKGEFENQFQENGDGTVVDKVTGLMWQKGGSRQVMSWSAARKYVEQVNRDRFAGYTDWRVPTLEELSSLIEGSWKNGDLFVDPVFERAQRQCWTSDTKGVDSAWKVNFHRGFIMDFPQESPGSIRLVRSLR
jgi:hypothetical protein